MYYLFFQCIYEFIQFYLFRNMFPENSIFSILLKKFLFFSLSSSIEGISIENGYFWIALSTSYDGNLPLNSISIGCGFSNPSYFGSCLAITFGLYLGSNKGFGLFILVG